jgi:chromosome segregation ATPase
VPVRVEGVSGAGHRRPAIIEEIIVSDQLIASLQQQIERLTADNLDLKNEAKQRRLKAKDLQQQNEKLQQQIVELSEGYEALEKSSQAEVAELQQRSEAQPHELQAEVDRLKGELRTRDHKAAFAKKAKAENVREDAVDDLWKVSGYEPEGDPDETRITEAIQGAVKVRPWLVAQQQAATSTTEKVNENGARVPTATPLTTGARPGPGAGRGVPDTDRPQTLTSRIDADFAKTKRSNPGRIA